jgi:probable HAF family extracellular repeat protein
MVRTWWHKLFSQGQSGVQRGDRRAGVGQRLMQKPLLESLEERCLLSYQITDLGSLPSGNGESAPYGINDSGQVVGESFIDFPNGHAFLWDATNGMQDGTLPGDRVSVALGINNSGQVVGYSYNGFLARHAFLWDATNGMQDLGTLPGGTGSSAKGINNAGQVVGDSDTAGTQGYGHAFLWQNGAMTDLGTLPGDGESYALRINDSGQVVGESRGAPTHAFLWDAVHGMQNLGTLSGDASAYGINDSGQVVGTSQVFDPNYYVTDAFVWQNGTMSDLNDLIAGGSGWTLGFASAINNAGQIVGEGTLNGGNRAFLLTPDSSPRSAPSGSVHFTSSDAQAVLLAGSTVTAADAGVPPFSLTLATLGDQALSGTDTAEATRSGRVSWQAQQASSIDQVLAGLGSKDAVASLPRRTLGGGSVDDPLTGSLWSL